MSHPFRKLCLLTIGFVTAWLAGLLLLRAVLSAPHPWLLSDAPDMFYYLLYNYESVATRITFALALLFFLVPALTRSTRPCSLEIGLGGALILAACVFGICLWGVYAVYQTFPVTLDEHAAFFQAILFEKGSLMGKLPPDQTWLGSALIPEFIIQHPDGGLIEAYLPVYAGLLALTNLVLGSPWFLNPLVSAGSVLLLYGVAKNTQSNGNMAGWALLFLVTSSQFIINGMSGYSMSCHLFFSLLWLFLYTHPNRLFYFAAPPLGVVAIGLHQPICHILFVIPFLIRLLLDRRWIAAVYSAAIYLAGGLGWIVWMHLMRPQANSEAMTLFGFPVIELIAIHLPNVLLLVNWQNFLGILLFLGALSQFRSMPPLIKDLTWGAFITFFFYFFFLECQGAGWGYRYMFPVLGNLCLIAAWGATRFHVPRLAVIVSVAVALVIQIPFRCHEVAAVVQRQVVAYRDLTRLKVDYVVINDYAGWYTNELMRNDPDFRNRPLMLFQRKLSDQQKERLKQSYRVMFIGPAEYVKMNIPLIR